MCCLAEDVVLSKEPEMDVWFCESGSGSGSGSGLGSEISGSEMSSSPPNHTIFPLRFGQFSFSGRKLLLANSERLVLLPPQTGIDCVRQDSIWYARLALESGARAEGLCSFFRQKSNKTKSKSKIKVRHRQSFYCQSFYCILPCYYLLRAALYRSRQFKKGW